MTHHHRHDHDHDHHHRHDHDHDHHHDHGDIESDLSFEEKILKLLDHWKKHNDEHAASYQKWAGRVRAEGRTDIAALMESAAEKTMSLNDEFQAAIDRLKKQRP